MWIVLLTYIYISDTCVHIGMYVPLYIHVTPLPHAPYLEAVVLCLVPRGFSHLPRCMLSPTYIASEERGSVRLFQKSVAVKELELSYNNMEIC